MWKGSLILALCLVIALPALAATTGDPIDSNDSLELPGCDAFERYPQCQPCWTQCLYAMIAASWNDGDWDNDLW